MSALFVTAGIAGFYALCAVLARTPLADAPAFDWLGLDVPEGDE